MNPKRIAPAPIIDNLNSIGNPFKQKTFSASIYTKKNIVGADVDLEYALKFLYSYNGSTATYNSYRREIERLLQWTWRIEQVSILSLKRESIEEYLQFCFNPPKAWIGIKNVARFKNIKGERQVNTEWRPFVVSVSKAQFNDGTTPEPDQFCPSQSSIKATFTVLSSFYGYLIQENLVNANPVALIRQKSKFIRKEQAKPIVRRISTLQWDYVLETAEAMASEAPEDHELPVCDVFTDI